MAAVPRSPDLTTAPARADRSARPSADARKAELIQALRDLEAVKDKAGPAFRDAYLLLIQLSYRVHISSDNLPSTYDDILTTAAQKLSKVAETSKKDWPISPSSEWSTTLTLALCKIRILQVELQRLSRPETDKGAKQQDVTKARKARACQDFEDAFVTMPTQKYWSDPPRRKEGGQQDPRPKNLAQALNLPAPLLVREAIDALNKSAHKPNYPELSQIPPLLIDVLEKAEKKAGDRCCQDSIDVGLKAAAFFIKVQTAQQLPELEDVPLRRLIPPISEPLRSMQRQLESKSWLRATLSSRKLAKAIQEDENELRSLIMRLEAELERLWWQKHKEHRLKKLQDLRIRTGPPIFQDPAPVPAPEPLEPETTSEGGPAPPVAGTGLISGETGPAPYQIEPGDPKEDIRTGGPNTLSLRMWDTGESSSPPFMLSGYGSGPIAAQQIPHRASHPDKPEADKPTRSPPTHKDVGPAAYRYAIDSESIPDDISSLFHELVNVGSVAGPFLAKGLELVSEILNLAQSIGGDRDACDRFCRRILGVLSSFAGAATDSGHPILPGTPTADRLEPIIGALISFHDQVKLYNDRQPAERILKHEEIKGELDLQNAHLNSLIEDLAPGNIMTFDIRSEYERAKGQEVAQSTEVDDAKVAATSSRDGSTSSHDLEPQSKEPLLNTDTTTTAGIEGPAQPSDNASSSAPIPEKVASEQSAPSQKRHSAGADDSWPAFGSPTSPLILIDSVLEVVPEKGANEPSAPSEKRHSAGADDSWPEFESPASPLILTDSILKVEEKNKLSSMRLQMSRKFGRDGAAFANIFDGAEGSYRRQSPTRRSEQIVIMLLDKLSAGTGSLLVTETLFQLKELGSALNDLALFDSAVEVGKIIIALCRRQRPGGGYPRDRLDLGIALYSLSQSLTRGRRWDEALSASKEALEIFQQLGRQQPLRYDSYIAASFHTISVNQLATANLDEALGHAIRSVGSYERLRRTRPGACDAGLAAALLNLSNCQSETGDQEAALDTIQNSVIMHRDLHLARSKKSKDDLAAVLLMSDGGKDTEVLGDLAGVLLNFSSMLSDAGKDTVALEAITECIQIRRQLHKYRPTAYETGLAVALLNFSVLLSKEGRHEDALAAIEECMKMRDALQRKDLAAYETGLPGALLNYSILLSKAGRQEEALAAIEECILMCKLRSRNHSAAHEAALAGALHNHSILLSQNAKHESALAAVKECVRIRSTLHKARPAVYEASLARSLLNLSRRLTETGGQEEALVASKESVDMYQNLHKARPAVYESDLAEALLTYSILLSKVGRQQEALAVVEECVEIRKTLHKARPAKTEVDLAKALFHYSNRLREAGRAQAALDAMQGVIKVPKEVYQADSENFEFELGKELPGFSSPLGGMDMYEHNTDEHVVMSSSVSKRAARNRVLGDSPRGSLSSWTSMESFLSDSVSRPERGRAMPDPDDFVYLIQGREYYDVWTYGLLDALSGRYGWGREPPPPSASYFADIVSLYFAESVRRQCTEQIIDVRRQFCLIHLRILECCAELETQRSLRAHVREDLGGLLLQVSANMSKFERVLSELTERKSASGSTLISFWTSKDDRSCPEELLRLVSVSREQYEESKRILMLAVSKGDAEQSSSTTTPLSGLDTDSLMTFAMTRQPFFLKHKNGTVLDQHHDSAERYAYLHPPHGGWNQLIRLTRKGRGLQLSVIQLDGTVWHVKHRRIGSQRHHDAVLDRRPVSASPDREDYDLDFVRASTLDDAAADTFIFIPSDVPGYFRIALESDTKLVVTIPPTHLAFTTPDRNFYHICLAPVADDEFSLWTLGDDHSSNLAKDWQWTMPG